MSPKETLVNLFGYTPTEADLMIAEMEMTFGPFPTPENIAAAREAACAAEAERLLNESTIAPNSLTISVTGNQGAGKTTVLLTILYALAQAALVSGEDASNIIDSPVGFLNRHRSSNGNQVESVEIKVPQGLLALAQQSMMCGESPIITPEPFDYATADLDAVLFHGTGRAVCELHATREEIVTYGVQGIVQSMVDDAFETVVIDADAKEVIFRVKLG